MELAILTYHIVNTIISIYCVLCVSSQLHDLINGKGTKDYYSRMVSTPSLSLKLNLTLTVSDVCLGVIARSKGHPRCAFPSPPRPKIFSISCSFWKIAENLGSGPIISGVGPTWTHFVKLLQQGDFKLYLKWQSLFRLILRFIEFQNERQRRVMEFILSMQMLQEFDNPADIPFPPPPLEGIDNAVFQHHMGAPLPPPLPTASASALDRPGSPAPPPPYSSLDRPPEYSTLPRVVMAAPSSTASSHGAGTSASHAPVQGTRRQCGTGVAQGILQRQSNSSNNTGNSSRSSYSPRNKECPAYSAPSLGSSWNTQTSSSTSGANRDVITSGDAQNSRSHGNASASHDVSRRISDDCDGYSDISSVSCPRRSNVHRV